MKRLASILLVIFFFTKTWGCVCYDILSLKEQLERCDYIFIGKVSGEVMVNWYKPTKVTLFKVEKYLNFGMRKYSNLAPDFQGIIRYSSCARYHYLNDSTYLVYAVNEGIYNTDYLCDRTSLLSDTSAKSDIKILNNDFGFKPPTVPIADSIFSTITEISDSREKIKALKNNNKQKAHELAKMSTKLTWAYVIITILIISVPTILLLKK